jgi:hypothetical protein
MNTYLSRNLLGFQNLTGLSLTKHKVYNRKGSLLFYGLLILLLSGCIDEPVRDASGTSRFVNIAGFIQEQTALLDSLNPPVEKKVLIGEKQEQQTLQQINWQRELELFLQADISKPALQASFEIEEQDKNIRIFRPKVGENPDIDLLKVTFDEKSGRIQAIEALISQENYLFQSEKRISLQCKTNAAGQTQIAAYQIKGFQKLIFNDKVPYTIQAKVL